VQQVGTELTIPGVLSTVRELSRNGLGEIDRNFREADFWPVRLSAQLPDCLLSARNRVKRIDSPSIHTKSFQPQIERCQL